MKRSLLVALLMTSCSSARMHSDTLHARASFDLRCPSAQLVVTEIDSRTAGVDGCGQRATYIYNIPASTWVLNSPASEQSQPGLAPAPPAAAAPGVPPGMPPGSPPGTLPGAPVGSPPGTPPGAPHH